MQHQYESDLLDLWHKAPSPAYAKPADRPEVGKANDRLYAMTRSLWQQQLAACDLPAALRMLHSQQMDIGFTQDDLSQVKYFQCYDEQQPAGRLSILSASKDEGDRLVAEPAHFIGMYNPRRAERTAGAGRLAPPRGSQTINAADPACFLCPDNVRWQQRGIQLYYDMQPINQRSYVALCNPFPFAPLHTTIALAAHEPQSWRMGTPGTGDKIRLIVEDLYDLAAALPMFVGFYNGVGAGATIEKHLHYHFFECPKSQQLFPLQLAAQRAELARGAGARTQAVLDFGIADDFYPLGAFRLRGARKEVVEHAIALVAAWDELLGDEATANVIVVTENQQVTMYVVPRNRTFSHSPGMAGIVGGLEALGEFVFCTPAEYQAISEQKVTFDYMRRILQAVRPPHGLDMLQKST